MHGRNWLTAAERKKRLHYALRANYDPWPDPPIKWRKEFVTVDGKCGYISEHGKFEPYLRRYLYPLGWI